MIKVEVRGGEKFFMIANNNNPMKANGGPGRTGRILPNKPSTTRIMLKIMKI